MRKSLLIILCFLTSTVLPQNYSDEMADKFIRELLSKMTLEEKVGQMTQITLKAFSDTTEEYSLINHINEEKLREGIVKYHIGSILNCGGSANTIENWHEMITLMQDIALKETRIKIPILYGIDAIHGATYTVGSTLFPQSIAMAASGNRELVRKSAEITALEVRASGIPWNFNPVLGIGKEPLWSRFWETFGEDTYMVSELGAEYIKGLQGDDISDKRRVAACMKHYIGYSVPKSGRDRTPAWIPDRFLREYFIPPFKRASDEGCITVMVNSSEINGIPVHSSKYYLKDILRDEIGFKGLVVSDWYDINNLYKRERVAKDQREAVKMAVLAGVDMSMVPMDYSFYIHLVDLVKAGEVPMKRIDEAVYNILYVKYKLGLFDRPYPDKSLISEFASEESAKINLDAAREVITLLKNEDNVLPLSKNTKVLVTGPSANMLSVLNGGWTITWQGEAEYLYPKEEMTILEAIEDKIGKENTSYVKGADFTKLADVDKALEEAKNVDAIIACIGENTYCETPGSINDLTLSSPQLELVSKLQSTGKPVILVLVEGRPRVIRKIEKDSKAVLMAYLPGMKGGVAIADVLFGDVNPSGKLPFTYPRYVNGYTTYDRKHSEDVRLNITATITSSTNQYSEVNFDPQWEFGYGLSYTKFEYSNLKLSKKTISKEDNLTVSVNVKNIGEREGKEIVQLYLSDLVATVTPSVKRLKGFTKISLKPGEEKTVTFELTPEAYQFIGRDNNPVIEPGEFKVQIGSLTDKFIIE